MAIPEIELLEEGQKLTHNDSLECHEMPKKKKFLKTQDKSATDKSAFKLQGSDKYMKIINCWSNDNNTQKDNNDLTYKVSKENKTLSDFSVYDEQKSVFEKVNYNQVKCGVVENLEGENSEMNFDKSDITTLGKNTEFEEECILSCTQDSNTMSELIANSKVERVIESTNNQKESIINAAQTQGDKVLYYVLALCCIYIVFYMQ